MSEFRHIRLPRTALAIQAAPRDPEHRIPGELRFARVSNAADDFELLIYGDIGENWWGESITAASVAKQISEAKAKRILVRINSYGGSVTDGTAIYNALRASGAVITCRIDGIAASIASLIAMAGDTVEMSSNTLLMVHAPWVGVMGNSRELREAADILDTYARAMATSYARKTGRTLDDELASLTDGVDHWFTASEAKEQGYADTLLDGDDDAGEEDAAAQSREQIVGAALTRYRSAPTAMAARFRARLPNLLSPSAAPAAHPAPPRATRNQESRMNWKALAKALNIKLSDDVSDAAARDAIAQHLKLRNDCSDDDIAAAMVTAGRASQPTPAAPAAAAAPTAADRVRGMFAAAAHGQANNERLAALQRQANIDIAAGGDVDVTALREQIIAAVQTPAQPVAGRYVAVEGGEDERDKRRDAGTNWLLARAAVYKRGTAEATALNTALAGNPYRGMSFADLARACLEDAGISVRGLNRHALITAAITQSTSDFPKIFENALHKSLLAGFTVVPTTWDRVCKVGTLSDFRPHIRYRSSSIGDLDVVLPNGEYKTLKLSDAERETISAQSRGGIINVSREMLVNDDMGVFTDLTMELGKSASRTREKALYVSLALNAGLGPNMGDGQPLFDAAHDNISADPGAPTVARVDKDRQQMASQMDPGSNDFVDIRPSIWLGPLALGGTVRAINADQYDQTAGAGLQATNISRGTYSEVIDTPRLTGAPWYSFADPNLEPVFEMGFLDGEQTPQIAMEEAFSQHGMKWRIVDEWGLAAIGFRGAIRNAGTGG